MRERRSNGRGGGERGGNDAESRRRRHHRRPLRFLPSPPTPPPSLLPPAAAAAAAVVADWDAGGPHPLSLPVPPPWTSVLAWPSRNGCGRGRRASVGCEGASGTRNRGGAASLLPHLPSSLSVRGRGGTALRPAAGVAADAIAVAVHAGAAAARAPARPPDCLPAFSPVCLHRANTVA